MRWDLAVLAAMAWANVACGGDTDGDGGASASSGGEDRASGGASSSGRGGVGLETGGTVAASGGTAMGGGTTGGAEQCPPCVPPPSPDCVGSGPCGCGPYNCPSDGGTGPAGGAGGAAASSCTPVSGDYGDCEAIIGWAFDGTSCQLHSGCSCGTDCDYFFGSAADCATTCADADQCRTSALDVGGIATSFEEGVFCDEIYACQSSSLDDLEQVLPLSSACESTSSCSAMTCPTSLEGTIDGDAWRDVCAATLLPGVAVTCWVWGP